jgi:hypothetical protein
MIEVRTQIGLLAKIVVTLGILLMITGVVWRGVSVENIERIWTGLLARPSGPMAFRFILQPAMAAMIAIRDGIYDARRGRPPFAWTILSNPRERAGRLKEALNATAKILLLALALDGVYQIVVLRAFFPYEALIIAVLLGFVPYVVVRGLASRLARQHQAVCPKIANSIADQPRKGRSHDES